MIKTSIAKFKIGQVIRHRVHAFRGVVFDVDPMLIDRVLSYGTIDLTEGQQRRDQPFYYLFAENERTPYVAYVGEQDLEPDASDEPVNHPELDSMLEWDEDGGYRRRKRMMN
jgi:heat shock protein HspQ